MIHNPPWNARTRACTTPGSLLRTGHPWNSPNRPARRRVSPSPRPLMQLPPRGSRSRPPGGPARGPDRPQRQRQARGAHPRPNPFSSPTPRPRRTRTSHREPSLQQLRRPRGHSAPSPISAPRDWRSGCRTWRRSCRIPCAHPFNASDRSEDRAYARFTCVRGLGISASWLPTGPVSGMRVAIARTRDR